MRNIYVLAIYIYIYIYIYKSQKLQICSQIFQNCKFPKSFQNYKFAPKFIKPFSNIPLHIKIAKTTTKIQKKKIQNTIISNSWHILAFSSKNQKKIEREENKYLEGKCLKMWKIRKKRSIKSSKHTSRGPKCWNQRN